MLSLSWRNLAILLVTAVVVLYGIGWTLPARWSTRQSIDIAVNSPELIEQFVADASRWPEWTVWNPRDVPGLEIEIALNGNLSAWTSEELGRAELQVVQPTDGLSKSPLKYTLTFSGSNETTVEGEFRLQQREGVWRLVWTEQGPLKPGSLSRWLGLLLVRPMASADMHDSLVALRDHIERTASANERSAGTHSRSH